MVYGIIIYSFLLGMLNIYRALLLRHKNNFPIRAQIFWFALVSQSRSSEIHPACPLCRATRSKQKSDLSHVFVTILRL